MSTKLRLTNDKFSLKFLKSSWLNQNTRRDSESKISKRKKSELSVIEFQCTNNES